VIEGNVEQQTRTGWREAGVERRNRKVLDAPIS